MKRGVSVAIIDSQGKTLVLKRSPDIGFGPNLWDLPGGRTESKEELRAIGKREAREEVGLEVELEDDYFSFYHHPVKHFDAYAFRAKSYSGKIDLSKEHVSFRWVSKNNWKELSYTPHVEAALNELFK